MIKLIPQIYENECVFSWLARTYARNGIIFYKHFVKDIFVSPKDVIDFNFINVFSQTFKAAIKRTIGFERLVLNHTLFKYYARFIPASERNNIYTVAIENTGLIGKKLHLVSNKKNYFLRYCPRCVEEDRKKYGECYFHVEHQIYDVHCCPKHGVRLLDTAIPNRKVCEKTFITLEQLELQTNSFSYEKSDINFRIAKYVYKVFKEELHLDNKVLISDYLSSKLNHSEFVDKACTKKNIIGLFCDIRKFYEGLNDKEIKEYKICDILRGESINPYDIALIAYYLRIKPKDLANAKLSNDQIKRPIIRRVYELYKKGYGVDFIVWSVGRNRKQVEKIINGYKKISKTSAKINEGIEKEGKSLF